MLNTLPEEGSTASQPFAVNVEHIVRIGPTTAFKVSAKSASVYFSDGRWAIVSESMAEILEIIEQGAS